MDWVKNRHVPPVVIFVVAAVLLAGCMQDNPSGLHAGVMGTNATVGDIHLLSVHVEGPSDAAYESGDDARLWLTLRNDGRDTDLLTDVRTPAAAEAEIRWDSDCDGQAKVVAALPLRPAAPAPAGPSAGAPAFDAYHVRLVGFTREVLAGTTIPVTFTFAEAGQVTVDTIIQPSVPRAEPSGRCSSPSMTPTVASS